MQRGALGQLRAEADGMHVLRAHCHTVPVAQHASADSDALVRQQFRRQFLYRLDGLLELGHGLGRLRHSHTLGQCTRRVNV